MEKAVKIFGITFLAISGIVAIFLLGYGVATYKWNCYRWGEDSGRKLDPEECNTSLGFPARNGE